MLYLKHSKEVQRLPVFYFTVIILLPKKSFLYQVPLIPLIPSLNKFFCKQVYGDNVILFPQLVLIGKAMKEQKIRKIIKAMAALL